MEIKNVKFKKQNMIMTIIINREKQLNAINKCVILELHHLLSLFQKDKSIRVIIITGAGDKAFSTGADIREFENFDKKEGAKLSKLGHRLLFDIISNYPKPIIAAIQGFALGGGLELALASHIRIASKNAKLGFPEVSLGLIPGFGGTQRLSQLLGKGKAMEMILIGEMISAEEAYKIGLVNQVVASKDLMDKAFELADKIRERSSNAIKKAIKAINHSIDDKGFKKEIQLFGSCFENDDFKEGLRAFLKKRKPNFK